MKTRTPVSGKKLARFLAAINSQKAILSKNGVRRMRKGRGANEVVFIGTRRELNTRCDVFEDGKRFCLRLQDSRWAFIDKEAAFPRKRNKPRR